MKKFELGSVVATPGALEALGAAGQSPHTLLRRHVQGDWGNLDQQDRQANDAALLEGSRILSSYTTFLGTKLWIITEADRSSTCILLPDEY